MKKYILFSFLIISFTNTLIAQKQDFIWLYGDEPFDVINPERRADTTRGATNIDFNYDPVRVYYEHDRVIDFAGANASLCDDDGKLLLYSNGQVLYDGSNRAITDTINRFIPDDRIICSEWEFANFGDNQMSIPRGLPLMQRIIILKMDDIYYAIYNSLDRCKPDVYQLLVSKMIKNQITNDFELITKDSIVSTGSWTANMHAVRHANGRDWWIVQIGSHLTKIDRWLLSPKGIAYVGEQDYLPIANNRATGQISFSPDGRYMAYNCGIDFTETGSRFAIAEFDRCTGTLGDRAYTSFMSGNAISSGFSHDSRYVYYSDRERLYQCDMESGSMPDVIDSCIEIAEIDGFGIQIGSFFFTANFGPMLLGPDGRMYISPTTTSNRHMSVIEYPYEYGEGSDVRQHSVTMNTQFFRNIPNLPHYRLGPLDGSPCDTLGLDNHPVAKFRYAPDTIDVQRIRFTDLSYYRPEDWYWDFGDGRSTTERYPWHRYDQGGTYEVCLTVSNENSSHTTCRTLVIGTSTSTADLPQPDITLYPNPVQDELLVILGEYIPVQGNMYLYDSQGRLVRTERIYYGWNSIDVSQLHSGIYFYRMMDGGSELGSGKVVKF
jgi:hypothetical protein